MNEEISIYCPYCSEPMVIEPEPYDEAMEYVEDCQVCCRPILITANYSPDGSQVSARRENE